MKNTDTIKDADNSGPTYVSWNNENEFQNALAAVSDNYNEYNGINRSYGSLFDRTFIGIDTNISVHSQYNRADYDYFRSHEAIPKKDIDIIHMCMMAYEKVSVVRSVIDMMADFTVQGIRIIHPNKNIENFYKNWWKKVKGDIVSERIANMLYRTANCPVKRGFGKIPLRLRDEWRRNHAQEDVVLQQQKVKKARIPLRYNILNPLTIQVIGGELSSFVGKPIYALKISHHFKRMMSRMEERAIKSEHINDMLRVIPDELRKAVKGGKLVVPIHPEKIEMLHYKKDDWKVWATPMLAAILESLAMLEKMHLADLSALDGAISQIRLWTLGDLEHKILPGRAAIARLRNILAKVGNGVLDLVWGPELDFKESNSQVHNYLTPDKYQQVMTEIYAGLGVPPSLTGSAGSTSGGFTNNFISMRTLIERLEYGRKVLIDFWNKELVTIQKAMGWRFPAKIIFDQKVLTDEVAEKKLLLDMWDRDIVATESIHEICKRDPEMEIIRVNRERRKRDKGTWPEKASPYHNPQWEVDLKKIILQSGGVAPSEVGLELEDKKEGEQSRHEQMEEMQVKLAKTNNQEKVSQQENKPTNPKGRPKNSKDKNKRQRRTVKPRTSAENFVNLFIWANNAQKVVSDILTPAILNKYNKKTLRSLTKDEADTAEALKLKVLCNLLPYQDIDEELVYNLLTDDIDYDLDITTAIKVLVNQFNNKNDKKPTLEELRQIQSSAYALKFEEENV